MARCVRSLLLTAAIAFAVPAALNLMTESAQAQSPHGLQASSDRYRQAAAAFEQHVYRVGYFDHYDKRLAGRLEDIACEFKAATHNPGDVPRLLYHWNDLTTTHARVSQSLVFDCENPDPALVQCWQPVAEAYLCLVEEMRCFTNPGQGAPFVSSRPAIDPYPVGPQVPQMPYYRSQQGANYGYGNGSYGAQPGINPGFGLQPQDYGASQGIQVDPRREIAAEIAAALLNRLLKR